MRKVLATAVLVAVCESGVGLAMASGPQVPQYFELFGYSMFGRPEAATPIPDILKAPAAQILAQDFAEAERAALEKSKSPRTASKHKRDVVDLSAAAAGQEPVTGTAPSVPVATHSPELDGGDGCGESVVQQEPVVSPDTMDSGCGGGFAGHCTSGGGCTESACTESACTSPGCSVAGCTAGCSTSLSCGDGAAAIVESGAGCGGGGAASVTGSGSGSTTGGAANGAVEGRPGEILMPPVTNETDRPAEPTPTEAAPVNDGPFGERTGEKQPQTAPFEAPTTHDFLGNTHGKSGAPVQTAKAATRARFPRR